MTERSPGVSRLQTTSDPDAVTGETRRLSRTFRGTRPEATAELQRFVTESGAGLQGGSSVTVAVLLESFMSKLVADVSVDDLVFTNDTEAKIPWRPELVSRWERLRKRAGLDHVKLHGLRHFVATQLPTGGIDLRTVSNRLGHARTSTTLDVYWAWVPAQDEAAAAHLDAVLDWPEEIH